MLLVALVAGGLLSTRMTTPFDEVSHFDYVTRVAADGDVPPLGDRLGQTALDELSCYGGPGFAALTCGAPPYDPSVLVWSGVSVATSYAPYYYVATGAVTRAIHDLGVSTWLVSARMANALWLLVLAWVLVSIIIRLGATPLVAFAGASLACLMPMMMSQSVTVGNDVAGVLVACIAAWWWLAHADSRRLVRLGGSLAFAVLAMGVKETATIALFLIVALEISRYTEMSGRGGLAVGWQRLRGIGVIVGSAFVAAVAFAFLKYLFWPSVRGVTDITSGMDAVTEADGRKGLFLAYRGAEEMFVGPTGPPSNFPLSAIASTTAMIAIGSLFFVAFNQRSASRTTRALAIGGALFFLLFPLLVWANLALFGSGFFFQPRYLLPVGVIGIVCFAARVGGSARWVFAAVPVVIAALYWLEMAPFVGTGFGTGIPPFP